MSAPRSKSTKERIAAAKLPERTVSICLRGDLVAENERLEAELKQANLEAATDGRMTAKKRPKTIAAQILANEAEMEESRLHLRLRALKTSTWRDLMRKYPPPKDSKEIVDVLPFMSEALPLSVFEPDDMDAEDWDVLQDNVPASEMTRLMNTVWEMNTQAVDIPKSLTAFVVNQRSELASK